MVKILQVLRMAALELRTLGDCLIVVGDQRISPQSPYVFAMALYLAVERGRPHTRDALASMFFPDAPEANAAHNVRQALYKLRQLGIPAETTPGGVVVPSAEVRDDYASLLALNELPNADAERLPGEFLPGYWPKISDGFTRWLESQRDAVNGALRRAYVSRIVDRRAVARWDQVEKLARACLAVDPLNEEATLALAEALALTGAKAAGVQLLDKYIAEVGTHASAIAIPATTLKRRISETRIHQRSGAEVPMVGREDQMRALNSALSAARARHSSITFLTGEPGIGKSRLLAEFVALTALGAVSHVLYGCRPHNERRPLGCVIDIARELLAMAGAIGALPRTLRVLQQITGLEPQRDDSDTGLTTDDVAEAFYDLLRAVSDERTLLIAIDDSHLLDAQSLDIFVHALHRDLSCRLMVLLAARPDGPPAVPFYNRSHRRLALPPLAESAAQALMRAWAASEGIVLGDSDVARIGALAHGNPYFIRTLVLHVKRGNSLTDIPVELRDLLRQQLAASGPHTKTVVALCSLLGRHATVVRIAQVSGLPPFAVASAVDEASLNRWIIDPPEGSTSCTTHPLINDILPTLHTRSATILWQHLCAAEMSRAALDSGCEDEAWTAYDLFSACGADDEGTRFLRTFTDRHAVTTSLSGVIRMTDAMTAAGVAGAMTAHHQALTALTREPLAWPKAAAHFPLTQAPALVNSAHGVEAALLQIELRRKCSGASCDETDWIRRIALDTGLSPELRVFADSILLAVADELVNPSLAGEALGRVEAIASSLDSLNPDVVRSRLIYHSTFGLPASAREIALALIDVRPFPRLDCAYERNTVNAADALERCDYLSEALDVMVRLFRDSATVSSPTKALTLAGQVTWLARQLGDVQTYNTYCSAVQNMRADNRLFELPSVTYNEALHCLDRREAQRAVALAAALRRTSDAKVGTRTWAMISALEVAASIQLHGRADPTILGHLRDWSIRAAHATSDKDIPAAVAIALKATFGESEAKRFADCYRNRRPTLAVTPILEATGCF